MHAQRVETSAARSVIMKRARMKDPDGAESWDGQRVGDSSDSSTGYAFGFPSSLSSGTGQESAISFSSPLIQCAVTLRAP